jgi:transcriptional regulator with PAS, ATPase and Fis domain
VAKSPQPVLITGETGTGKELIARAIHDLSQRPGPFVAVNAAGLDDALFSDTLFGHTKGAFTSARAARKGLVEQAAEGTLFLDEIGDLSTASQVRLLRLAQEREYYPIGSDLAKRSRTRLVLATNRELESMQENGTFRKDLYFRLQTHKVNLPPLRDRLEDLPLLVDHFLEKSAREMGRKKPTPPRELFDLLNVYHYPGNIRELEGLVWEAVGGHRGGVLNTDVFRAHIERHTRRTDAPAQREAPRQIAFPQQLPTLQEMRRLLVEEALKRANGNQAIAAQLLGITRTALNKWLKRHQEEED